MQRSLRNAPREADLRRHRPVALGLLAALLVAISSAGCGSSTSGSGGLSSTDAAQLRADVAAARTAASRQEAQQAAAGLVAFRQRVTRLAAEHKLTAAQAQALETGAQQAQARIALDVKAPPTPTTTITTPAPPSPTPPAPAGPPGKAKEHPKPPGKDKHGRKGHGGD